jgi:hypothetical protein
MLELKLRHGLFLPPPCVTFATTSALVNCCCCRGGRAVRQPLPGPGEQSKKKRP